MSGKIPRCVDTENLYHLGAGANAKVYRLDSKRIIKESEFMDEETGDFDKDKMDDLDYEIEFYKSYVLNRKSRLPQYFEEYSHPRCRSKNGALNGQITLEKLEMDTYDLISSLMDQIPRLLECFTWLWSWVQKWKPLVPFIKSRNVFMEILTMETS